MLRSLLLGKLAISIIASFIVGWICITRPSKVELEFAESAQWTGLGIFFMVLGLAQIVVIYFLTKKKR
jgi:undecaprenyl pyrophosphate phosphatase UppP